MEPGNGKMVVNGVPYESNRRWERHRVPQPAIPPLARELRDGVLSVPWYSAARVLFEVVSNQGYFTKQSPVTSGVLRWTVW